MLMISVHERIAEKTFSRSSIRKRFASGPNR
jgi:hypothetical protein